MNATIIAEAENWLKRKTGLGSRQRIALARVVPVLIEGLLASDARVVGLAGPPGSGKSTLARLLGDLLNTRGTVTAVLSLDDYYLTRAERLTLAAETHPLFQMRGVPGTHDLGLLLGDLDGLLRGDCGSVERPEFDKSQDDRRPRPRGWRDAPPAIILLEGWCIGCPPPPRETVMEPINDTERQHDPEGGWRQAVIGHMELQEAALHTQLDLRWCMAPPNWDCVVEWRWQQERDLGDRRRLRDVRDVRWFLETFERLGRHLLSTCDAWADAVIHLDETHGARL